MLKDFYRSKEWESFRKVIIGERSVNGMVYCDYCGKPIINKYDLIIHHKTELTEGNYTDASVALNPDNVVCVHFKCHNAIHERFNGTRKKQVFIVWGSPCAGKTTWVHENAKPTDIVVDLDNLFEAISINERYKKPDALKENVFRLRECLYDDIKHRLGRWDNAYIIVTAPMIGERERLVNRVGADDIIFIDCPKEICLLRAKERDEFCTQLVNTFFDMLQQ